MDSAEEATWDDAAYEFAIRQVNATFAESDAEYVDRLRAMVERGRADGKAGRTFTTN